MNQTGFSGSPAEPNGFIGLGPDDSVSSAIWNQYFEQLLRFAKHQMRGMPKVASDEEDITLSVLKSVCLSLKRESTSHERQNDCDDLWGLLVVICKRKIANLYAFQRRTKRDSSRSESIHANPGVLEQLQSREICPEVLFEFNERLDTLFGALERDMLKEIALAKIHGFTNQDIADRLGCSLSTVERKLRLIREIWSRECESN